MELAAQRHKQIKEVEAHFAVKFNNWPLSAFIIACLFVHTSELVLYCSLLHIEPKTFNKKDK